MGYAGCLDQVPILSRLRRVSAKPLGTRHRVRLGNHTLDLGRCLIIVVVVTAGAYAVALPHLGTCLRGRDISGGGPRDFEHVLGAAQSWRPARHVARHVARHLQDGVWQLLPSRRLRYHVPFHFQFRFASVWFYVLAENCSVDEAFGKLEEQA